MSYSETNIQKYTYSSLEVTCRLIVSSLIISVSEKNENIYVIFIMTMADDESDKDGSKKKLQFYNARPINR